MEGMSSTLAEHAPSLLALDFYTLSYICQLLSCPSDLARLQQTCKALHRLIQPSDAWSRVLGLNYGFHLVRSAPQPQPAAPDAGGIVVPHNKVMLRVLHEAERAHHSVRFAAVFTDGGVDVGSLHYWADHMFIPNSWAPYCAKFADNVNCLAVLKTGPGGYAELTHRSFLIRCLKWVVPLLQQQVPQQNPNLQLDPARVEAAAELLASWKTLRLESFFCQMAARLAFPDPLGRALLHGLSGSPEERRARVLALATELEAQNFYDRAYRLRYLGPPPRLRQQQAAAQLHAAAAAAAAAKGWPRSRLGQPTAAPTAGAGEAGRSVGLQGQDRQYVMDERAVCDELMTTDPLSSVAILHALSVSREGRLSCPLLSGALLAGLLPPGWPGNAMRAAAAAAGRSDAAAQAPAPLPHLVAAATDAQLSLYEAVLHSTVDQQYVAVLNDKKDAESVFAACAGGQLPPWVRHVVLEHAEFIELLPPHLAPQEGPCGASQASAGAAGAAAGSSCSRTGSGDLSGVATADAADEEAAALRRALPQLHPVVWFRFKEHAVYGRRNAATRGRSHLRNVATLCRAAASVLDEDLSSSLTELRSEIDRICSSGGGTGTSSTVGQAAGGSAAGAGVAASDYVEAGPEPSDGDASRVDHDGAGGAAAGEAEAADGSGGGGAAVAAAGPGLSTPSVSNPPRPAAAAAADRPQPPPPRPGQIFWAVDPVLQAGQRLLSLANQMAQMVPELREEAEFELQADEEVEAAREEGKALELAGARVVRELAKMELTWVGLWGAAAAAERQRATRTDWDSWRSGTN